MDTGGEVPARTSTTESNHNRRASASILKANREGRQAEWERGWQVLCSDVSASLFFKEQLMDKSQYQY